MSSQSLVVNLRRTQFAGSGFPVVLGAHEHEPVKASWRVWGELERAQVLESLTRVTLGRLLPFLRPSFLIHLWCHIAA